MHNLIWRSVGGHVVIRRFALEQQIAHASANEIGLMAVLAQNADN
jgi:hypothetical protein